MARLPRKYNQQRHGQALLIAVLLMFAILLVGALFVAIVNYNQQSSVRHSDMIAAQGLAEAGIRYADYMLQYSAQGADWRPLPPPAKDTDGNYFPDLATFRTCYTETEEERGWCPLIHAGTGEWVRFGFTRYPTDVDAGGALRIGRGHLFLRVTYDPDPPYEPVQLDDPAHNNPTPQQDPLSKYIKIEAIGVVDDEGFVFRRLEAYKPIALTDYLLFVTDRSRRAQPTILGYNPWIDMNKDNSLNFFTHEFHGPMRFNTPVQLEGQNFDSATALPANASTTIYMATAPTGPLTPDRPGEDEGGGYLRDDRFETMYNVSESYAVGTDFNVDAGDNTLAAAITSGHAVEGSDHLSAPQLFAQDPATGTMRWYALTRDSGVVELSTFLGSTVNTGQFGHGQGIYVDNFGDIQRPDLGPRERINWLIQDWLHNLPEGTADSGWNPVGEVYDQTAAVQIELFPTEDATIEDPDDDATLADDLYDGDYQYEIIDTANPTDPLDIDYDDGIDGAEIWWPNHVSGEPGIRLERRGDDGGAIGNGLWCIADPAYPDTIGDTTPQTRTMYLDYPQPGHQVIFAEGNIRIKGRLPRPEVFDSGDGSYNLTVVSRGTIYIDGQLLSPQDQFGRVVSGSSDPGRTGATNDQDNTYIALLARDCVVVNPTMLVPLEPSGSVPAQPDNGDPSEQHWELSPAPGQLSSNWYFGATPIGQVNLVAQQTTEDVPVTDPPTPGPIAAVKMNIYNAGSGAWQRYVFDQAGESWDPESALVPAGGKKFVLVRDGAFLLDSIGNWTLTASRAWAAGLFGPPWCPLDGGGQPDTPWDLAGYLSLTPGELNDFEISYAEVAFLLPYLGAGHEATPYWLKKFKIEELGPLGETDPRGAIHAKINAVMYAENGCFFVIPAPYFYEDATGSNVERFLRYNYDIEIRGAITENFHPGPAAVREWQEKWAWPDGAAWNSIRYVYDETILAAREQATTTLTGPIREASAVLATNAANLPKLPLLPVSPDLIYYGE